MDIETVIKLNQFCPRGYQREVIDAIENKGYKKLLLNFHRRAGKDVVAFNIMIRAALKKVGLYLYFLPTQKQGKKVLWDGILSCGSRFLSFIPTELITNKNNTEMKITLVNGSIIQVVGSNKAMQNLVGTNPQGVVFSEWSRSEPSAYTYIRPALVYNKAWVMFISTPFGKNHMYEMDQIARNNPKEWFSSIQTINDTGVISMEDIQKEKDEGLISDDLIQQEYFGSYEAGAEGSYYSKYIQKMYLDERIGDVPWEPSTRVHSAWDLGVHDKTIIILFSIEGQIVRILDYYENSDKGLDHYVKVLQDKPYIWGNHYAPHDIAVRELSTGLSRIELARRMGINFKVLPNIPIEDGIELCKITFSKLWIDETKCAPLIKALENYRRIWDPTKKIYQQKALHDNSSHYADAFRYMCMAIPKCRDSGSSPEELDRRYAEAVHGHTNNIPRPFQERY